MSTHTTRTNAIVARAGLALVALLAGPALADQHGEKAIEIRLQQYESRFNQSDPGALSKLFSEDAVYYGPLGRVFEGRDAIKKHYQDNMTAGFSDMAVEPIEIKVVDHDTAFDVARYTITGPKGQTFVGYHLGILKKVDGEWIVQRTLVNAKPPAKQGRVPTAAEQEIQ